MQSQQENTLEQAATQLGKASKNVDNAASILGATTTPDARLIENAFKQIVLIERQVWQVKTDLQELVDDLEIDYRLRSVLSSSRSSYMSIPYILSGLHTLAQLSEKELQKSDTDRNVLLENLREGMQAISSELKSISRLLAKQIEDR